MKNEWIDKLWRRSAYYSNINKLQQPNNFPWDKMISFNIINSMLYINFQHHTFFLKTWKRYRLLSSQLVLSSFINTFRIRFRSFRSYVYLNTISTIFSILYTPRTFIFSRSLHFDDTSKQIISENWQWLSHSIVSFLYSSLLKLNVIFCYSNNRQ